MNIKILDKGLIELLNEVPKEIGEQFDTGKIVRLFENLTDDGKVELICLLTAFLSSRVNIVTAKQLTVVK